MKNKNNYELIKETIKKLKSLDSDKFYFINAKLECPHCNHEFGIEREYIGVITCPYCGKYVEG